MRVFGKGVSAWSRHQLGVVKEDEFPLHQLCQGCTKPIGKDDSGFLIPFVTQPDKYQTVIEIRPFHVECMEDYFKAPDDEDDDEYDD